MRRPTPHQVVAAAFVLALVLFVFGPLMPELATHFIGVEYVDHYGTQWFFWFVDRQLVEGGDLGYTDLFFFPWGKDIYAHTGANVLDALLAVPFRRLLGHTLGYNVFVLAGLVFNGVAFHRFVGRFTDDRLALGVGSALFAVNPYVLGEVTEGRPTQAILGVLVLFLHYTWRSGRQRGVRAPVAAGVLLAVCGYQYWYYAFFGGMGALAHGIYRAVRPAPDAGGRIAVLGRHTLIAVVAVGLCLPTAWKLVVLTSGDSSEIPGLLDTATWSLTANPPVTAEDQTVGLFLWQPLRRLAGYYVLDEDGTERFLVHEPLTTWVTWLLFGLWLARPGRTERGPVLAVIGVATLLAIGPFLLVGKALLPNPFYITLVKQLGFMQRLWWPARAYALAVPLLLLGATLGLAWTRQWGRSTQVAVAAVACVGTAADLTLSELAPMPRWDATVPAGYRCLADGPEGALVELPYAWTQAHLYYQLAHGRPILGGMIENNPVFTPPQSEQLRTKNTFIATLISLSKLEPGADVTWTEQDKEAVRALGYRYVTLQRDAFFVVQDETTLLDNAMRTRLRAMRKHLVEMLGRPVYEDARVNIYAPWGDPRPCAGDAVQLDAETIGRTDNPLDAHLHLTPEKQEIFRVWGDDALPVDADDWRGDLGDGVSREENATVPAGNPAGPDIGGVLGGSAEDAQADPDE